MVIVSYSIFCISNNTVPSTYLPFPNSSHIRCHTGHFLPPCVDLVQTPCTTYQQDILVKVARPPSTPPFLSIILTWDLSKWSLSCSSVLALLVPNTLGIFLMEVILELACYSLVLQEVPHPTRFCSCDYYSLAIRRSGAELSHANGKEASKRESIEV